MKLDRRTLEALTSRPPSEPANVDAPKWLSNAPEGLADAWRSWCQALEASQPALDEPRLVSALKRRIAGRRRRQWAWAAAAAALLSALGGWMVGSPPAASPVAVRPVPAAAIPKAWHDELVDVVADMRDQFDRFEAELATTTL